MKFLNPIDMGCLIKILDPRHISNKKNSYLESALNQWNAISSSITANWWNRCQRESRCWFELDIPQVKQALKVKHLCKVIRNEQKDVGSAVGRPSTPGSWAEQAGTSEKEICNSEVFINPGCTYKQLDGTVISTYLYLIWFVLKLASQKNTGFVYGLDHGWEYPYAPVLKYISVAYADCNIEF
ncbi:hypothetical protein CEXT_293071 [Caerostris extrusa]|uniref:Uncharacterized protein n=1 Tax=Caerostris extrusa TaxID=172846 RepID=A0AAV4WJB2_CAEEX|nr:hypothetical protein CEXT_293071 [Caerostris extrusa]